MSQHARGTFQVSLEPKPLADDEADPTLGRMAIVKRFEGELEGIGRGEMLSSTTAVEGSAAYVAIEQVIGALNGRRGTFVLQHSGRMSRGAESLSVTVVPDSGTNELVGLAGTMRIEIVDGVHRYDLEYDHAPSA